MIAPSVLTSYVRTANLTSIPCRPMKRKALLVPIVQVVFEANLDYWDKERFPQVRRIIFDQTLQRKEAVELLKTSEGRVDLVTDVRPLDTLRVAQSPFGRVVKERSSLLTVLGMRSATNHQPSVFSHPGAACTGDRQITHATVL